MALDRPARPGPARLDAEARPHWQDPAVGAQTPAAATVLRRRPARHHRPPLPPPPGALALDRRDHRSGRPAPSSAEPRLTSAFPPLRAASPHRSSGTRHPPDATAGPPAIPRPARNSETAPRKNRRTVIVKKRERRSSDAAPYGRGEGHQWPTAAVGHRRGTGLPARFPAQGLRPLRPCRSQPHQLRCGPGPGSGGRRRRVPRRRRTSRERRPGRGGHSRPALLTTSAATAIRAARVAKPPLRVVVIYRIIIGLLLLGLLGAGTLSA